MAGWAFDRKSGRYRDAGSGRFLPAKEVRQAVDNLADAASERAAGLTRSLLAGGQLADWQQGMMALSKSAHVAAGVAAHGGRDQMAPADWLVIAREVKADYQYLRKFAQDIRDGTQPIDGRLEARARLYGQSPRSTFEAMRGRDERNRGMRFERNILGGSEACVGCVAETGRGQVPIGSLVPIGHRRPCLVNCRCHITYSAPEAVS